MIEQPITVSVYQEAGISIPIKTDKRWGYELLFINGEGTSTRFETGYCMKQIFIQSNLETSMHFHLHKHETLYVMHGTLTVRYNDGHGSDGKATVKSGEAFVIPPGFQHKLCAGVEGVMLLEASTIDDPNDSIRVNL